MILFGLVINKKISDQSFRNNCIFLFIYNCNMLTMLNIAGCLFDIPRVTLSRSFFHLATFSSSWFPGVSSRSWLLFVSFALAYLYQADPSSNIPFETCHLFWVFFSFWLPSVATLGSPRMSPVEPPWFVSLPVASRLYQALGP